MRDRSTFQYLIWSQSPNSKGPHARRLATSDGLSQLSTNAAFHGQFPADGFNYGFSRRVCKDVQVPSRRFTCVHALDLWQQLRATFRQQWIANVGRAMA